MSSASRSSLRLRLVGLVPGNTIICCLCSTSCTGFLCGCASCSRLQLSSTGPCLATPWVTWLMAVGLLPMPWLVADAYVRQLHSADTHTLVVSRTCRGFGDRTFVATGPQVWNSLLPNLRLCVLSYGPFWLSLKTFLPRVAMHKRGLCRHAVSVCVSVTNKDIFKSFSPSSSHTLLDFPYQTGW